MGTLEEAIREHLELKRRHGAEPKELERIEHEALSDAAIPAAAEPTEPADEPVIEVEPALEQSQPAEVFQAAEPEPFFVEEAEQAQPLTAGDPLAAEQPVEPEEAVVVEDEPLQETQQIEELELEPTQAHAIEEWLEDEPEAPESSERQPAEEEDLLGGTPEFLEETPEHDKLWFEQQKPRDFDFGE